MDLLPVSSRRHRRQRRGIASRRVQIGATGNNGAGRSRIQRTEVRGRRRLLDDFFRVDEAEVTDSGRVSDGGGVAAEQEEIRIVRLSPDEARAALRAGRLPDAKMIIALQWLFAKSLK